MQRSATIYIDTAGGGRGGVGAVAGADIAGGGGGGDRAGEDTLEVLRKFSGGGVSGGFGISTLGGGGGGAIPTSVKREPALQVGCRKGALGLTFQGGFAQIAGLELASAEAALPIDATTAGLQLAPIAGLALPIDATTAAACTDCWPGALPIDAPTARAPIGAAAAAALVFVAVRAFLGGGCCSGLPGLPGGVKT